ncbi:MAG: TonB-dependent receptor, partial [Vicinamibacterales bacterium]
MPALARAQSASATVSGTVRDTSGQPIAGATVRLDGTDTGSVREATSGAAGHYDFGGLATAARQTLHVDSPGFRSARRALEPLTAGERRLVDVQLEPAGVNEAVVVTADGPLGLTVSPELGGNLGREQIERLPVNGRDLIAVAYLIPGAAPARGFYNLAPRLTINGASSLTTNYSVDGFDNTDLFLGGPKVPITIGATDNLKVLVNSYSSEYGRTGNGVFSVTTRSGTNSHTANLAYVIRPGAVLDSPNFFAPVDAAGNVIDDSFTRHQVAGSAGGPLARNRLFYFVDVEVTRERQDAILTSPLALGLAPTRFNNQTGTGKLDARWNDRQSTTVRYQLSDYTHDQDLGFIGGLTLPSAGLKVNYRNQFAALTHRTIWDSAVNEIGVQVGRLRSDWQPLDAGPRVVITDRGATLAVLGGASDSFLWTETDLQVRDTYTRIAGRHTFKAGGDFLRGDFFIDSGPGARGAYVVDLEGRPVTPAGPFVAIADIPRDVTVLSYSQSFVNPDVPAAQVLAGVFVEDTFRATSDVTLTLGARWDYDSVTNTPVGDGDWNNVAPRLGVSWTPSGSARHQLRGGYGIFYERIPFAVYSDTLFNDPVGGAVSVTFAPGTPFAPPPFPSTVPRDAVERLPLSAQPPRNVQVFDPELKSPFTEQVSAGYSLSVTADLAVS